MLYDLLIGAIDAGAAWTRRDPGRDVTVDPAALASQHPGAAP
jgi:hypothetical protein